jgi:hypothetical protein
VQAPLVASQSVGLHAESIAAVHCAAQQFPEPNTPQMPERHTLSLVQAPVACCATHCPLLGSQ